MTLPGPFAAKRGYRYEKLWTMRAFLRLLRDDIVTIRIDVPGLPDTEFSVDAGSYTELHQVKRRHDQGKWTIGELRKRGVITAIGTHLLGTTNRFVFASGSDAPVIATLCEAARAAESDTEFIDDLLTSSGKRQGFDRLCRCWKCDDRTAIQVLRRIDIHCIDERLLEEGVRSAISSLFIHHTETVFAALGEIFDSPEPRTLTKQHLLADLARRGCQPHPIAAGSALSEVQSVTDMYLHAARPPLIGGAIRSRPQTADLLTRIDLCTSSSTAQDIVVTGKAGSGKTTSVIAAVKILRTRSVPILAFRLDLVPPDTSSTLALGKLLDLDRSPVHFLEAAGVATRQPAFLVVDQMDVASRMSGRSGHLSHLLSLLFREVRAARQRQAAISVVVVCRSFDFQYDTTLSGLVPSGHLPVEIGDFSDLEVAAIVAEAGFDSRAFRQRQFQLLRLPQNLSLFLACHQPHSSFSFATATALYDKYWDDKRRAVWDRCQGETDSWAGVVFLLCSEMTDSHQLFVAREKLDHFSPTYLRAMVSEGVLTFDDDRYGFGHESFLDYCFARRFCADTTSLASFLIRSSQDLFRRAQVRQVLAYLRESDHSRYVRELRHLFSDKSIRAHIKDLVLAFLADLPNPTSKECDLWDQWTSDHVDSIAVGAPPPNRLAARAWRRIQGSLSWFSHLHGNGLVAAWLRSSNERLVDMAVKYLMLHQPQRSNEVADSLRPYVNAGGAWSARFRRLMDYATYGRGTRFTDLLCDLLDGGILDHSCEPQPHNHLFSGVFRDLIETDPKSALRVLRHWLQRRVTVVRALGHVIERGAVFGDDDYPSEVLQRLADGLPREFVRQILPIVLDISDRGAVDNDSPSGDAMWATSVVPLSGASSEAQLVLSLATALGTLAGEEAITLDDVIVELTGRDTYVANYLLLAFYSGGGARYADVAVDRLCAEPWRLRCGHTDSPRWGAMKVIGAVVSHCTPRRRRALEDTLLEYRSPFESSPQGYKEHGRATFDLLSAIPADLRSRRAQGRYLELERKCQVPTGAPQAPSVGIATSPIPTEAASRMTDDQWLSAFAKYDSNTPTFTPDGVVQGGALELSRELEACVKDDTERFARLALRFPLDAHWAYFEAVLRQLENAPISPEIKIAVCRKAMDTDCDVIRPAIADVIGRIEDGLPDDGVRILGQLAVSNDKSADSLERLSVGNHNGDDDLFTRGLNTTRGRAAQAMIRLIASDHEYIERFRRTIYRMVEDPSAPVLSWVAGVVEAVWRIDSELGSDLFETMIIGDDRLLATDYMEHLLHHRVIRSGVDRARPFVRRMLRSAVANVREVGGRLAALAGLYHDDASDLSNEALRGCATSRLGVAQVASRNLGKKDCREWCEATLICLFDDDDAGVVREAARAFSNIGDQSLGTYGDLILRFCDSGAFRSQSRDLLQALKASRNRLPGLTIEVCEKVLDMPTSDYADYPVINDVATLVFRTYQQRQESDEWRERALDLIDRLCLEGAGAVHERLEEFDR